MRAHTLGVILALWSLPWAAGAQPRYDLLLKGGHVLDPMPTERGSGAPRNWRPN